MKITDIFVNKLKIETKVVSIDSLFSDEGKVKKTQYAPPYQRNYVWDAEKATYFLESILIGTEIPPLIFFRNGSKLEIIDGRQRYETILRFLRGDLRLSKAGLKKLDVLNIDKKMFGSLPEILKNDFLDTKLRVIEFSFASHDGITQSDEDSVKQEIFKRYNSGITPLKAIEIDKAIYFEDDLNTFFKEKLKESGFHDTFTNLFKYEDMKVEISLKKIRQLLVLHKIPIKYYSIAKQKVADKYYDLLFSQIKVEDFDIIFESFKRKLKLIDMVRDSIETRNFPYNRLISETLFWAYSIMEDNNIALTGEDPSAVAGFADHILRNISVFKMDRSSFANEIVTRYKIIAEYLESKYGVNKKIYIETNDEFKHKNRELNRSRENITTNFQELRINKPEPSTYTIDDICRQMKRSRFLVRPPYQREEVINKKKSSEIIESLLLGIKLPPIFIFKNKNGISEVIDGQQRILSILAFLGRSYMNENGETVKSNKDGFALQLKDSILTGLNGKHYTQLNEEQQDKITNFDLWVIEINARNNPDFEPLDLFIRLNNKPYPIKDDTFEMWNSYIDRGLIDTIKASYNNCLGWFFMRKKGNRMENENNYTVLSYFNYLEMNCQESTEKGPLDIYKVGPRIAFRLRSKGDISRILENVDKRGAFVQAVNHFEFSFIANLKRLLIDEEDDSDKTLNKNLDEMLGVENGKRTQQSFYVLWYFLKELDSHSIDCYRTQIRKEVRLLFAAMSSEITTDEFNKQVENFRSHYRKKGKFEIVKGRIGDVVNITSFETEIPNENGMCDFFIKRDNKLNRRITIKYGKLSNLESYYWCHINRMGFNLGYVIAVLQSSYVFKKYDFGTRNITVNSLRSIPLPLISPEKQFAFDNVLVYTKTQNLIQCQFFENLLDKMVEEVYHPDLFESQKLSLFKQVMRLEDLRTVNDKERDEKIDKVYFKVINGTEKLMSDLSAAAGITGSYNNEKDN